MKVIAAIPVYGRLPLLKHTIRRLYEKNGVDLVICSGHLPEDKALCEKMGAKWVQCGNVLGKKWNAAFVEAGRQGADAVLFVGSSDWVSDNWLEKMLPYLEKHDMVGKREFYQAHIHKNGNVSTGVWLGYKVVAKPYLITQGCTDSSRIPMPASFRNTVNSAKKHSKVIMLSNDVYKIIGIGRLIRSSVLSKIGWSPFDSAGNSAMDGMLDKSVLKAQGTIEACTEAVKALSLSTDLWSNKHRYGKTSTSIGFDDVPFDEMVSDFPELINLRNDLCENAKSV